MARLASAALYSAPLAYFGNKVQKNEFLHPVLSGEKVGALALTEPQAASDAGSTKTRARRDGRDFILDGEKRFITNGGVADYLFLFVVTYPSRPPRSGLSAFVVPRKSKGLDVVKGLRSSGNERRQCRSPEVAQRQCPRGKSRRRSQPWFPNHS